MLNVIVGTFLGFNLVLIECLIAYALLKKSKVERINRSNRKER